MLVFMVIIILFTSLGYYQTTAGLKYWALASAIAYLSPPQWVLSLS